MTDEPESLTLRYLRRIDAAIGALGEDMREVKTRLSILEQQVGLLAQQYASLSSRIDRIEGRLERIERRLELVAEETP